MVVQSPGFNFEIKKRKRFRHPRISCNRLNCTESRYENQKYSNFKISGTIIKPF